MKLIDAVAGHILLEAGCQPSCASPMGSQRSVISAKPPASITMSAACGVGEEGVGQRAGFHRGHELGGHVAVGVAGDLDVDAIFGAPGQNALLEDVVGIRRVGVPHPEGDAHVPGGCAGLSAWRDRRVRMRRARPDRRLRRRGAETSDGKAGSSSDIVVLLPRIVSGWSDVEQDFPDDERLPGPNA